MLPRNRNVKRQMGSNNTVHRVICAYPETILYGTKWHVLCSRHNHEGPGHVSATCRSVSSSHTRRYQKSPKKNVFSLLNLDFCRDASCSCTLFNTGFCWTMAKRRTKSRKNKGSQIWRYGCTALIWGDLTPLSLSATKEYWLSYAKICFPETGM